MSTITAARLHQKLPLGREFDNCDGKAVPDIFRHVQAGEGFCVGVVDFDLMNDVVSLAVRRCLWSTTHALLDQEFYTLGLPVPTHATFDQVKAFVDDPVTRPAACDFINSIYKSDEDAAWAKLTAAHARHFGFYITLKGCI